MGLGSVENRLSACSMVYQLIGLGETFVWLNIGFINKIKKTRYRNFSFKHYKINLLSGLKKFIQRKYYNFRLLIIIFINHCQCL